MNNHSVPDDFDWRFYCNYYNDLKLAGIDTEKKARDHYINFGRRENRVFNPDMVNQTSSEEVNTGILNDYLDFDDNKSFYGVNKHFSDYLIKKTGLQKDHKILE